MVDGKLWALGEDYFLLTEYHPVMIQSLGKVAHHMELDG
jgi:hypothetical protein